MATDAPCPAHTFLCVSVYTLLEHSCCFQPTIRVVRFRASESQVAEMDVRGAAGSDPMSPE